VRGTGLADARGEIVGDVAIDPIVFPHNGTSVAEADGERLEGFAKKIEDATHLNVLVDPFLTKQELAALKRTGLRDYFEFDLGRAKTPAPVGPVALRLKDADAKRHKFNMVLVVDDMEIEKKDKTLLEPVQFYRKGSRQLNEIVAYAVEKDRITGYLSMPKAGDAAASSK